MIVITLDKAIPGFEHEAGGHRVQRVPTGEKRGRVHTSTVTCAILNGERQMHAHDQRHKDDFEWRWFRGTGSGGQHRNKHANCLELKHLPTGISQIATGRSRDSNAEEAMRLLLQRLDHEREGEASNASNLTRKEQIGKGMRGDKKRTYRFQDDRIADHETGKNSSCSAFMRGNIEILWPSKDQNREQV